ncbi:MAG: FliM/FliN family flagellar motor switch protein [Deferribacteraceae bacterium]|jgi:flagellar motor switch protein FliN/FliY|nr:FliM/FliN family flagellar motor switch protein [Deferribacteraceae bacterium]
MRTPLDLAAEAGLKQFSDLITAILNANFRDSITGGEEPGVAIADAVHAAPEDLLEGFESGTIITATEEKSGFDIGLIFKTQDITRMADLMLAGDGESKDELDNDSKDSAIEIANMYLGAVSAAAATQMDKKLGFKVDNASKFISVAALPADSYITFDFAANIKGSPIQFRQYMDENFSSLLETQDSSVPMDFFGDAPAEPAAAASGGGGARQALPTGNANLDMLMDIDIPVSVCMGSAKLFLKDILGLGPGNIIELDQNADELIELTVNEKLIARGEVVIVDGYFGFRIKEIISRAERIKKLKD